MLLRYRREIAPSHAIRQWEAASAPEGTSIGMCRTPQFADRRPIEAPTCFAVRLPKGMRQVRPQWPRLPSAAVGAPGHFQMSGRRDRQSAVPLSWQFSITALRLGSVGAVALCPEICMSSSTDSFDGREGPEARREFLKKCGRFAVVTPPAMTLLLSVSSMPREAYASTIGHRPPGWPSSPRPPFWPPGLPWPF